MYVCVCMHVYIYIYINIYIYSGSAGKESARYAGDLGSILGMGWSPGEGKGYPLQYSGLDNSMDCIGYGVTKSETRLSDFHFHFLSVIGLGFLSWGSSCSETCGDFLSLWEAETNVSARCVHDSDGWGFPLVGGQIFRWWGWEGGI